jgi:hypothetical protein
MKINNLIQNNYDNKSASPLKTNSNINFNSILNEKELLESAEEIGHCHYLDPIDIELRIYRINNTDEPLYKVNTLKDGKLTQTQIINPKDIDMKSASSEELFAMNSYLYDKKLVTGDFSIVDSEIMAEYHPEKQNALEIGSQWANMQLSANNMESYLLHKKLIDILYHLDSLSSLHKKE